MIVIGIYRDVEVIRPTNTGIVARVVLRRIVPATIAPDGTSSAMDQVATLETVTTVTTAIGHTAIRRHAHVEVKAGSSFGFVDKFVREFCNAPGRIGFVELLRNRLQLDTHLSGFF